MGFFVSTSESSMICLLLRGAGAGALLFHELFKTGRVHGQPALAGHEFGEVEREAVGVVELEGEVAGDRLALRSSRAVA